MLRDTPLMWILGVIAPKEIALAMVYLVSIISITNYRFFKERTSRTPQNKALQRSSPFQIGVELDYAYLSSSNHSLSSPSIRSDRMYTHISLCSRIQPLNTNCTSSDRA